MNLTHKFATVRRLGPRGLARSLLARAGAALWIDETLLVFRIRPGQVHPVTARWDGAPLVVQSASAAEFVRRGRPPLPGHLANELVAPHRVERVHWIEARGEIASWGFSTAVEESWPLSETRSRLRVPAGSVCLTAFETVSGYRGHRFYPAILTQILAERFHAGASAAYIWCDRRNTGSHRAIRRVGFETIGEHRYSRRFGLEHRSSTTSET